MADTVGQNEITEEINGQNVVFRSLGTSVLISATHKFRELKSKPCRDAVNSFSGASVEIVIGQVNAAIETIMRHMIPSRQEIVEWLQTDEGILFMIDESLKRGPDKTRKSIEVFDCMDLDQIDRVMFFLLSSIIRRSVKQDQKQESE